MEYFLSAVLFPSPALASVNAALTCLMFSDSFQELYLFMVVAISNL